MADKYDKAIEIITEKHSQLDRLYFDAYLDRIWNNPGRYDEGCLFQFAGNRQDDRWCGCLTQIRDLPEYHAHSQEMTEAIRADERIPPVIGLITPEILPVFAEWQRKIDEELPDIDRGAT